MSSFPMSLYAFTALQFNKRNNNNNKLYSFFIKQYIMQTYEELEV
jgi:hypothetical protein